MVGYQEGFDMKDDPPNVLTAGMRDRDKKHLNPQFVKAVQANEAQENLFLDALLRKYPAFGRNHFLYLSLNQETLHYDVIMDGKVLAIVPSNLLRQDDHTRLLGIIHKGFLKKFGGEQVTLWQKESEEMLF